jgi:hypothetical protein
MTRINLIPKHRLASRQRRAYIRRWAWGGSAYVALLALGCLWTRLGWDPGDRSLSQQIQSINEHVTNLHGSINSLGPQLAQAQSSLETSRIVMNQPNWSTLLTWLSNAVDDHVVLSNCELKPITPPDHPDQPAENTDDSTTPRERPLPDRYIVHLQGLGISQASVSDFVLRLEQSGLFDRVILVGTTRKDSFASPTITFELECPLSGKGGQPR